MIYLMKTLTFSGLSPQNTLGRQRSKADRSPYENYPLPLRGSQSPRTHIKTILPNNQTENNANEIYQVKKTKTTNENGTYLIISKNYCIFEFFLINLLYIFLFL
jgi:hypothetical protein